MLLESCLLAILLRGDTYGYALTQVVKEVISVSESTLYPVLRRLQNADYLVPYDIPYKGRNRRYYQITEKGKLKLEEYIAQWQDYKSKIDAILLGGAGNGQV